MSDFQDSDEEIVARPFQEYDTDVIEEDGGASDSSESREMNEALERSRREFRASLSERTDLEDALDISQHESPADIQELRDIRAALALSRKREGESTGSENGHEDSRLDSGALQSSRLSPGVISCSDIEDSDVDGESSSKPHGMQGSNGAGAQTYFDSSEECEEQQSHGSRASHVSARARLSQEARDLQMALQLSMSHGVQGTEEEHQGASYSKRPRRT